MKRKICFVTGSRAEYDLLKPLITLFCQDADFELLVIATGMHLSPEFGFTVKAIEQDHLPIADRVEMLLSADTECAIAKSTGLGIISFADSLRRLQPDILVVLGDRFEILSAVIPAFFMKVPIVHISGGDITKGAFDEGIRHAITKMSYLHFTATREYQNRVIQLGESPERVFNVGAIGIESMENLNFLSKKEMEQVLGLVFHQKNILVTFHPVTLEQGSSVQVFSNLLSVLAARPHIGVIFTKANADNEGRAINNMIDQYVIQHPSQAVSFTSLGQLRYLSAMRLVDAVVGNSSSGIVEAPSLHIGTINIGDRQTGRVKATSIIDCLTDTHDIEKAFELLFSKNFQNMLKTVENPYKKPNTSKRIFEIIKNHPFDKNSLKKEFYDIKFQA